MPVRIAFESLRLKSSASDLRRYRITETVPPRTRNSELKSRNLERRFGWGPSISDSDLCQGGHGCRRSRFRPPFKLDIRTTHSAMFESLIRVGTAGRGDVQKEGERAHLRLVLRRRAAPRRLHRATSDRRHAPARRAGGRMRWRGAAWTGVLGAPGPTDVAGGGRGARGSGGCRRRGAGGRRVGP
jgi:hypothetical protein